MSNTDVGKKKNLYIAEKPSVAKQEGAILRRESISLPGV